MLVLVGFRVPEPGEESCSGEGKEGAKVGALCAMRGVKRTHDRGRARVRGRARARRCEGAWGGVLPRRERMSGIVSRVWKKEGLTMVVEPVSGGVLVLVLVCLAVPGEESCGSG